ncbi:uncharacterized protein LOC129905111 [Episyrphus balteatus]|uniref:uncharacterized protein LOC129905111 n=1 Tax=Episyrphus balteatus TaxID=286459 RepID=UPI002485E768|nr:uncharacterized protein LOC129905111 [Episyrphus balteatus]
MIIVVLLFFQSLCLYLQNIVLKIHDKWLNPKHARLLIDKEQRRLQLFALKPKHPVPGCSFCSNSPLGYCRHHNPNQPTLRHLKNRLLAKGGGGGGGGGGAGIRTTASNAIDGVEPSIELETGCKESGERVNSIGGSSISSTDTTTTPLTPTSTCDILANYFDRKDPDKICTCLSCSKSRQSSGRSNRTSWGTRNGTVIWGERVVPNPKTQSLNGSSDENGLEIVAAPKRRRRRYEKYGGFH